DRRRPVLEHIPYISDTMQSLLGILLQTAPEELAHLRRNPLQIRLLGQHLRQRVGDLIALEHPFARQQLVQHYAPRPDVGALVDLLPLGLLWGHVTGGSKNHTDLGRAEGKRWRVLTGGPLSSALARERLYQAEIEQLHDP